jgi:hypothetical protein
MEKDYRKTKSGIRRFGDPETYQKSLEFQNFLQSKGIAWHNVFADECTIDFSCCEGDGEYLTHFPSYYASTKQLFEELFEKIKHGDKKHQEWLWNEMQKFLKDEVLWEEP